MSCSRSPSSLTILPKYAKLVTCSVHRCPNLWTVSCASLPIVIVLVLFPFILRPKRFAPSVTITFLPTPGAALKSLRLHSCVLRSNCEYYNWLGYFALFISLYCCLWLPIWANKVVYSTCLLFRLHQLLLRVGIAHLYRTQYWCTNNSVRLYMHRGLVVR